MTKKELIDWLDITAWCDERLCSDCYELYNTDTCPKNNVALRNKVKVFLQGLIYDHTPLNIEIDPSDILSMLKG